MTTHTDIQYGQRLRGLRLAKGWKQSDAGERLGINTQQQYSRLENGQAEFTDEVIQRISEVFGITPDQFTSMNANYFSESHFAFSHNGTNAHMINDLSLIQEILKAKDEVIRSKDELIATLKSEIETGRSHR